MVSRESQYAPGYVLHAVSRYDRKLFEVRASNKEPLFPLLYELIRPLTALPTQSNPSISIGLSIHSSIALLLPPLCRPQSDSSPLPLPLPFFQIRSAFSLPFAPVAVKARTSRD